MKKEYSVYVLSDESGSFYKGMTNNIVRRMKEHNRGKTQTTRKMSKLKLIYLEKYESLKEAREREKYLKTAAGRRFIKKILGN